MGFGQYIDYIGAVDSADPDLKECNAAACPRLYLNGWPAFTQLPWLREYIINPTFVDDVSGDLVAEQEEVRELLISAMSTDYRSPSEESRQQAIDNEYWDFSKLFISPKGSLTRLHFDNGGAHAWLTQVRGRKLHICFPPSDGPHLHAFEGDEGLLNGSWLDPLDAEVLKKWPDYANATPHVAVVEQGETIFAPQGWWHYSIALDTSVTVMRNFYSKSNRHEYVRRKDEGLASAFATSVLKHQAKLRNQPDEKLKEIARRTVAKVRATLAASGTATWPQRRPHSGGPAGCFHQNN